MHNRKFREFNYYRVLLYDLYTIYKYPIKKVHEVFNKILSRIYKPVVVVIAALTLSLILNQESGAVWERERRRRV